MAAQDYSNVVLFPAPVSRSSERLARGDELRVNILVAILDAEWKDDPLFKPANHGAPRLSGVVIPFPRQPVRRAPDRWQPSAEDMEAIAEHDWEKLSPKARSEFNVQRLKALARKMRPEEFNEKPKLTLTPGARSDG